MKKLFSTLLILVVALGLDAQITSLQGVGVSSTTAYQFGENYEELNINLDVNYLYEQPIYRGLTAVLYAGARTNYFNKLGMYYKGSMFDNLSVFAKVEPRYYLNFLDLDWDGNYQNKGWYISTPISINAPVVFHKLKYTGSTSSSYGYQPTQSYDLPRSKVEFGKMLTYSFGVDFAYRFCFAKKIILEAGVGMGYSVEKYPRYYDGRAFVRAAYTF